MSSSLLQYNVYLLLSFSTKQRYIKCYIYVITSMPLCTLGFDKMMSSAGGCTECTDVTGAGRDVDVGTLPALQVVCAPLAGLC